MCKSKGEFLRLSQYHFQKHVESHCILALRDYFLIRQTKDFNNRIVDSFYSSLLNLPKPFFDTRKIGELVARLNDTQRVQRVIKEIVGNVVINALVTIVSLGFLFFFRGKQG